VAELCTGCELCIPVCPVDCIRMEPVAALPDADASRQRFAWHQTRLKRDAEERAAMLAAIEAEALAKMHDPTQPNIR
jgi:Na+-translocating ferredoxin:NAD+ oxidoreductase subunit B